MEKVQIVLRVVAIKLVHIFNDAEVCNHAIMLTSRTQLYDVLPGDNQFTSPCTRNTFTNSSFTRVGLDSLLQASNVEVDATSTPGHCLTNNSDYRNTATCSSVGLFTLSTFNRTCFTQNHLANTNSLDILNERLNNMQGVLTHDDSKTGHAAEDNSKDEKSSDHREES
jgi:hypothetical protein